MDPKNSALQTPHTIGASTSGPATTVDFSDSDSDQINSTSRAKFLPSFKRNHKDQKDNNNYNNQSGKPFQQKKQPAPAADGVFTLVSFNGRGLNDTRRQNFAGLFLVHNDYPDAVLINETKLQSDMQLAKYRSFQTPHFRRGGVWSGTTSSFQKHNFIRSFKSNASWSIGTIRGVRIHFINLYIPCNTDSSATDRKKIFEWSIFVIKERIFASNEQEYVVVTGDFNKQLTTFKSELTALGLSTVVPAGKPTHYKGGHLDNIFTNLTILSHSLLYEEGLTDHLAIRTTLKFRADRKQTLREESKIQPQAAVVGLNLETKTIQTYEADPNEFDKPLPLNTDTSKSLVTMNFRWWQNCAMTKSLEEDLDKEWLFNWFGN